MQIPQRMEQRFHEPLFRAADRPPKEQQQINVGMEA
jgi:hypothetical protein